MRTSRLPLQEQRRNSHVWRELHLLCVIDFYFIKLLYLPMKSNFSVFLLYNALWMVLGVFGIACRDVLCHLALSRSMCVSSVAWEPSATRRGQGSTGISSQCAPPGGEGITLSHTPTLLRSHTPTLLQLNHSIHMNLVTNKSNREQSLAWWRSHYRNICTTDLLLLLL